MLRRPPVVVLLAMLVFMAACTNKKVVNPLASVGSKQPDKVLFDRAMDAMKHNKFDVARLTLQTLINTYPDSEYIARAKLGVADSWYAEGGSTAMAQAEIEYNDFKTFFPNMPEAAEAQLKIANIHYQEMEKPDRDYTHALRAQEEYRNLIMQFPDSKLVPAAKQRLMEVQEVLAEREYMVGRFYYLKETYPAAIARLQSVVEKYPLYSKADEVLYMLGQSYEAEIKMTKSHPDCVTANPPRPVGCIGEGIKARLADDFSKKAAETYSRILTRYPVMDRSDDAKARLIAMHQPVPRPTKAALAQNKAEEDSRRESSLKTKVIRGFSKHPDVAQASRVGDPPLVDPEPVSAKSVVEDVNRSMVASAPATTEKNGAAVEMIGTGAPPAGQDAPRSDSANPANPPTPPAVAPETDAPAAAAPAAAPPAGNELGPNVPADANELKPNVPEDNSQALPPPQQVNEISTAGTPGGTSPPADANGAKPPEASSPDQQLADDSAISSSKHKKKKGLKKVIPF
jgi:outer membrane protein assembly factor BamD